MNVHNFRKALFLSVHVLNSSQNFKVLGLLQYYLGRNIFLILFNLTQTKI